MNLLFTLFLLAAEDDIARGDERSLSERAAQEYETQRKLAKREQQELLTQEMGTQTDEISFKTDAEIMRFLSFAHQHDLEKKCPFLQKMYVAHHKEEGEL